MIRYSIVAMRETGERAVYHGMNRQGRAIVKLLGVSGLKSWKKVNPKNIVHCLTERTLRKKRKILERI